MALKDKINETKELKTKLNTSIDSVSQIINKKADIPTSVSGISDKITKELNSINSVITGGGVQ